MHDCNEPSSLTGLLSQPFLTRRETLARMGTGLGMLGLIGLLKDQCCQ